MPSAIASSWTDLTTADPNGADKAYSRLSMLFRDDAFVQMLSTKVIDALKLALVAPTSLGVADGDALATTDPAEVAAVVREVFARSPLGLVNDQFISHVADLAVQAIVPSQSA